MFKITKKDRRTKLEKEIESVIEIMSKCDPSSKEYTTISNNLETLYKAQAQLRDDRISWNTIAVIAGNLLGILLILGYEKANIITSKAFSHIIKGRV